MEITLTDYHITTTVENRHADIITLFAWKVPESSRKTYKGGIGHSISIKGNSQTLSVPNPIPVSSLKSIIFGAEAKTEILLRGHDERGRQVEVTVASPPALSCQA